MRWIVLVALTSLASGAAAEEARAETDGRSGAELFFTHCGACHGVSGEGDGPVAAELKYLPPDLTRIAERNGGEYPADAVRQIIDGRKPLPGHGGPEMPIWGDAFKTAADRFSEEAAQAKIAAIVAHLATLQKVD
jgi:mono/diheme cytochrome c family protein